MSGKNMLDGFSRILDIHFFSAGEPPDPLEKWDIRSEPSTLILQNFPPHHRYQPARGTN